MVVISHTVPVNKVLVINTYSEIKLRWAAYFATGLQADSVSISVIKSKIPYHEGPMVPVAGVFYEYSIFPLQHGMTDEFIITVTMNKGECTVARYTFTLKLNFAVFITINVNSLSYNSTNPPVNYGGSTTSIIAWIDITYPVSYHSYYLNFSTAISKEFWEIRRVIGSDLITVNVLDDNHYVAGIDPHYRYLSQSIGIINWQSYGNPSAGQKDRLYFTNFRVPSLAAVNPGSYSENMTVFTQNFTLYSTNYFNTVTVRISPGVPADGFGGTDENWTVYINGVKMASTLDVEHKHVVVVISSISSGQIIDIMIQRTPVEEVPPPPPDDGDTFWDLLVAFFTSIIMAILSLLGLATVMNRRKKPAGISSVSRF
jgi:hypothetical protein